MTALLAVDGLNVWFGRSRSHVLKSVTFAVQPGERVGLIGESGSGKSVTALALLGLLAENATTAGTVTYGGRNLLALPERELARLRGQELTMVFQEPMTALDPTMRVGRQVAEVIKLHDDASGKETRARVVERLGQVGLPDPAGLAEAFPHELSGGQRQRVILAMALMNRPRLVICDEPTTALDVTVQAQVLALLDHELTAAGAATLFISHDLAVVAQVCQRVMVMLDGEIVEQGPVGDVLSHPAHPYTQGLIATARLDRAVPGSHLPTVDDFYARASRPAAKVPAAVEMRGVAR
ncbi:MAG: ABC transporter ATP-binding protein [Propionibacteriaceae bacterium]|jgi:peptide/nickel transport system ATP-binding protein|nr:ABC transporter ATP-binding protein [Propionibacteriaceae bacterium]